MQAELISQKVAIAHLFAAAAGDAAVELAFIAEAGQLTVGVLGVVLHLQQLIAQHSPANGHGIPGPISNHHAIASALKAHFGDHSIAGAQFPAAFKPAGVLQIRAPGPRQWRR